MNRSLTVVPAAKPAPPETVAERIQRLQRQIEALGNEQVNAMRATVMEGLDAAREVAANPSHPPGVRQIAEKIARDGESLLTTLEAIQGRAS